MIILGDSFIWKLNSFKEKVMRVLIISGGTPPSQEILSEEVSKAQYIIAVDKGLECLYQNNILPDIIVGDFDSVDKEIFDKVLILGKELIRFPSEKDFTDTQVGIDKAIEMKAQEIVILGATGSRLDHTLANVGILHQCMRKGVRAYIKDGNNCLYMSDKESTIEKSEYKIFSLVAFGGIVKGLTIIGAKYSLDNYDLHPEDNITISNEFIDENVKLSFESGVLLIIYSRD